MSTDTCAGNFVRVWQMEGSNLDHLFSWELAHAGDTLSNTVWDPLTSGLTLSNAVSADLDFSVRVSGVVAGETYQIRGTSTFMSGATDVCVVEIVGIAAGS